MNVAQLKVHVLDARESCFELFPRLNERGSIEGRAESGRCGAEPMGFHV